MRSIPWKAMVLMVASVFFAPAALALSVIPPTFEGLVSEAETVVDGRVTAVRCGLEQYQGRPIVYTYVTIAVLDVLKGPPVESVELKILGGAVGNLNMEIPGVPKFALGERNLFFIAGNGSTFCPLVAVPYGYYRIAKRAGDGAEVVLRSNGAPLMAPRQVADELHGVSRSAGAKPIDGALTLADFKSSIRAEVAHAREP